MRAAQRPFHQHAGALAAVEAQERVSRQRLARVRARAVAPGNRHQRLLVERCPHQCAGQAARPFHQHRRVELAGFHLHRQLDRLGADQAHVQRRVFALHARHHMRQAAHHRNHRAHGYRACHRVRRFRGQAHLVVEREHAARLWQQLAAAGIERHHPAAAVEQLAAQLHLERPHLQADRGLRQGHPRGGGGKGAVVGHGNEGAQETDGAHGKAVMACGLACGLARLIRHADA